jgi:hypothetical protein
MRFVSVLAAVAALWVQPAVAAEFLISGTATGFYYYTQQCSDQGPQVCQGQTPVSVSFTESLTSINVTSPSSGLYSFSLLAPKSQFSANEIFGTFKETAPGSFVGTSLVANGLDGRQCRGGFSCGFYTTANAFSVQSITASGVPEPTTWAMMLLGFGLIGGAMRQRVSSTRHTQLA